MTEWDRDLLADTLRKIMNAAGLSQLDVARLAGRNRTMVSRWLSGEFRPAFAAARSFSMALTNKHPEMAELAGQFMTAAGYGDSYTPAGEESTGPIDVQQLRAIAAAEGKTIGEVLTEHGVDADELVIPDALPLDPIIAEIEAEDLPEATKQRLIKIYLDHRAEIFEAERIRVEREREARERQSKPERTKPGA